MNSGVLFKDLTIKGNPIRECEIALECNNKNYRLYVAKYPEYQSFEAIAFEFVSSSTKSFWDCENLAVNELMRVTAYHDGVRHLWVGSDEDDMGGYIYCPDMAALSEILTKIREIELEICTNCD